MSRRSIEWSNGAFIITKAMLDAVMSLQFGTVETIWRHFWRSANNNEAVDVGMEEDPEKMLPKYITRPSNIKLN